MIRLLDSTLPEARAVVFDKDGVLVDFAPLWSAMVTGRARAVATMAGLDAQAESQLLARMGAPGGTIDPTGPLVSATRTDALTIAASYLYERGTEWLAARAIAEEAFQEAERSIEPKRLVRATGDLAPTLRALRQWGVKLAVATTDLTTNARRDLELLGLADCFEVVLGSDAVERSKPHPDLFLLACERLGVPAKAAWMVGDALADVRMARNAGAGAAIAVTSGVTTEPVLRPEADRVIAGVWELPGLVEPVEPDAIDPALWYELYSDGAARGNPGPAALGAVILAPGGRTVAEFSEPLGVATNNVAEYRALLRGLKGARELGIRRLVVKADSELMIKQLKGDYAVKSDVLRPLFAEAIAGLRALDGYRLLHVRREANRRADALANEALDRKD